MWVVATYVRCRVEGRSVSQAVVTAIALGEDGRKRLVGLDCVDTESYAEWKAFLAGPRARGLSGLALAVSDARAGLARALSEAFQGVAWQRCTVRLQRDVAGAVRRKADVSWFNGAVTAQTRRTGSHVPGVTVHLAREEAGRSLVLVGPRDVGHVTRVKVDGAVEFLRRFGFLCGVARERSAADLYAYRATARFLEAWAVGGQGPGGPSALSSLCVLHELVRCAHSEWMDGDASRTLGRPVWDERRISGEHGLPEGAWWRAAAEGEFYSTLGRGVADALVWRPAVSWYRATCCDETGPADAAEWLGLPRTDSEGNDMLTVIKDAWRDAGPVDDDGVLEGLPGVCA